MEENEYHINDFIGDDIPSRAAFRDISKYLREQDDGIFDEHGDIWVYTPRNLDDKEVRALNNYLGVHKVNKDNFRMTHRLDGTRRKYKTKNT